MLNLHVFDVKGAGMKKEFEEMEKSVRCLAIELPEKVWDDVSRIWGNLKAIMNPKTAFDYAQFIKRVAQEKGDERASKCGYDLMMGFARGDVAKRVGAWERYLKETEAQGHVDSERDGVWAPAIAE